MLAITTTFSYQKARAEYIYRDKTARELNYPLDGVVRGLRLIKTNSNTYQLLSDLKTAIDKTGGRDYAIIPGMAACWVKSLKVNPLSVDWVQHGALYNQRLYDRVIKELRASRGRIIVIVEKINIRLLAEGFVDAPNSDYYVVAKFVRTNFTRQERPDSLICINNKNGSCYLFFARRLLYGTARSTHHIEASA